MLQELRKIAQGVGGYSGKYHGDLYGGKGRPGSIGGMGEAKYEEALHDALANADPKKFSTLNQILEPLSKRFNSFSGQMGDLTKNMMSQALIYQPLTSMLGGFLEVFEPISDAMALLGESMGDALAPTVSALATTLVNLAPTFKRVGDAFNAILEPLAKLLEWFSGLEWSTGTTGNGTASGASILGGAAIGAIGGWLGGAAIGAAYGASVGPWGILIGAGIGALAGWLIDTFT